MAEFKVINIIRYDILELMPDWSWTNRDGVKIKGNKVRISGLVLDESRTSENSIFTPTTVKNILSVILKDKYVRLENPIEIEDKDALIECNVVLNGVNICDYFPDLQNIS